MLLNPQSLKPTIKQTDLLSLTDSDWYCESEPIAARCYHYYLYKMQNCCEKYVDYLAMKQKDGTKYCLPKEVFQEFGSIADEIKNALSTKSSPAATVR